MSSLPVMDLVIAGVLAVGIWRGSRTGAVRQLAAVAGLVAAVWLGMLMMRPAGMLVVHAAGLPPELGPVVGFVSVAGVVVTLAALAAFVGRKTLALTRLGFLDTGLGAALGGLRMAVVLSLLLLISSITATPTSGGLLDRTSERQSSVLYEPVRSLAPALWVGLQALTPGFRVTLPDGFTTVSTEASTPPSDGR